MRHTTHFRHDFDFKPGGFNDFDRRAGIAEKLLESLRGWREAPENLKNQALHAAAEKWAEQIVNWLRSIGHSKSSRLDPGTCSSLSRWASDASQLCNSGTCRVVADALFEASVNSTLEDVSSELLEIIENTCSRGKTTDKLSRLGHLKWARTSLAKGNPGRTVREARRVVTEPPDELSILALEVLIDAYSSMDAMSEQTFEALMDWELSVNTLHGSVGAYAGKVHLDGEKGNRNAGRRSNEVFGYVGKLLGAYSESGQPGSVLRVAKTLMDEGFHEWTDPHHGMGISDLVRKLNTAESQNRVSDIPAIFLIELEKQFGTPDEAELVRLLRRPMPVCEAHRAVFLGPSEMRETRFEWQPSISQEPIELVLEVGATVIRQPEYDALKLDLLKVQVFRGWGADAEAGILFRHSTGTPMLEQIAFLVQPVVVGTEIDLMVQRLLDASAPTEGVIQGLRRFVMSSIDDVPGFASLEAAIVRVTIECGRHLASANQEADWSQR